MEKNPFLAQTAIDYDLTYEEVEDIYNRGSNSTHAVSFYESLELYIKNKANRR